MARRVTETGHGEVEPSFFAKTDHSESHESPHRSAYPRARADSRLASPLGDFASVPCFAIPYGFFVGGPFSISGSEEGRAVDVGLLTAVVGRHDSYVSVGWSWVSSGTARAARLCTALSTVCGFKPTFVVEITKS